MIRDVNLNKDETHSGGKKNVSTFVTYWQYCVGFKVATKRDLDKARFHYFSQNKEKE